MRKHTRNSKCEYLPAWIRFFGLVGVAVGAGHETREGLEEESEDQSREHVRLAQAGGRKAEKVPSLAEGEADRSRKQDRDVGAAAVAQEGVAELTDDEDQEDGDDEAGRDELHVLLLTPLSPDPSPLRGEGASGNFGGRSAPSG